MTKISINVLIYDLRSPKHRATEQQPHVAIMAPVIDRWLGPGFCALLTGFPQRPAASPLQNPQRERQVGTQTQQTQGGHSPHMGV